jgi:type IV secretion system protein VirB10
MRFAVLILSLPWLVTAAEIPQGTHVALRLVNSITTRTAEEGNYVYMETATPIVSQGRVVVPVGSYVQGVVSHVRRSGRVSGKAELAIRIDTLTTPSGAVIQVNPHLSSVDAENSDQKVDGNEGDIKQGSNHAADAARVATLSGTGAAIGGVATESWKGAGIGAGAGAGVGLATVLLTRGREVQLPRGATVDVVFERAVPVD